MLSVGRTVEKRGGLYENIAFALAAALAVAGCTTAENDAALGGAAGAVVGAASGVLLGAATRKGECRYRDRRGRVYIAACPAGYH